MRRLVLGAVLVCVGWGANAADVEKGAEDLLRNASLSQPFTIFDQLLLSLAHRATVVARSIRPEKNDFRPSRLVSPEAMSFVSYEETTARTLVKFDLTVSGIDDPWRDVCAKHLKDVVTFGLALPYSEHWKQGEFNPTAFGFFSDFLGPRLASNTVKLQNYKTFSDSIVVILEILVESGEKKKSLKFLHQCVWDNKTSQISFRDHKY